MSDGFKWHLVYLAIFAVNVLGAGLNIDSGDYGDATYNVGGALLMLTMMVILAIRED